MPCLPLSGSGKGFHHATDSAASINVDACPIKMMTPEELAKLQRLYKLLESEGYWQPSRHDPYLLRRFLKARNYDVQAAHDMFISSLKWRQEHGADTILDQVVLSPSIKANFLNAYPHGLHKVDREGRPVLIYKIGGVDVAVLRRIVSEEQMKQCHVQGYEHLMNVVMPACSRLAGRHIDQVTTIIDLDGIGLWGMGKVKSLLAPFLSINSDNYPETLARMLIIKAPLGFQSAFEAIKGLINKETQKKIQILSKDTYQEVVLQHIAPENLLKEYGGTSTGDLRDNIGPWHEELQRQLTQRLQQLEQPLQPGSLGGLSSPVAVHHLSVHDTWHTCRSSMSDFLGRSTFEELARLASPRPSMSVAHARRPPPTPTPATTRPEPLHEHDTSPVQSGTLLPHITSPKGSSQCVGSIGSFATSSLRCHDAADGDGSYISAAYMFDNDDAQSHTTLLHNDTFHTCEDLPLGEGSIRLQRLSAAFGGSFGIRFSQERSPHGVAAHAAAAVQPPQLTGAPVHEMHIITERDDGKSCLPWLRAAHQKLVGHMHHHHHTGQLPWWKRNRRKRGTELREVLVSQTTSQDHEWDDEPHGMLDQGPSQHNIYQPRGHDGAARLQDQPSGVSIGTGSNEGNSLLRSHAFEARLNHGCCTIM